MRLGASLRWLGYPSGFSPILADSLPFWTKIFWPSSERTKSINSFAAIGLQLRLIRRSRISSVLRQQRRSATARRGQLIELGNTDFESWAKESFEIATKIAYLDSRLRGSPKAGNKDCRDVQAAAVLPVGYVLNASRIADRRMILAGCRLADLLTRITQKID
jgi:hypothetical protein